MRLSYNLFAVLLWSCSPSSSDEKLLREAAAVHNAALQLAEELETRLRQSEIPPDSATVLLEDIEAWENDLVEVPGNTHHHHAGHTHSHEPVHVTPKEMLLLQTELKHRIEQIKNRVDALTP